MKYMRVPAEVFENFHLFLKAHPELSDKEIESFPFAFKVGKQIVYTTKKGYESVLNLIRETKKIPPGAIFLKDLVLDKKEIERLKNKDLE